MIHLIKADLLKLNVQYIVHQTNCQPGVMGGLAGSIVKMYPQANTKNGKCKPGQIDVFSPVINMYAQYNPGYAFRNDSEIMRLRWFKSCLWQISQINDLEEVAFPHGIGCGLAGGNWADYESLILDFAHYVHFQKNVNVYIARLP